MRGKFIAVEGCDKVGKTTLVKRISATNDCVTLQFPDRTTKTGKIIDEYLKGQYNLTPTEANMLFVDNKREKQQFIKETLLSGKNLIVDRYVHSGIVYSLANKVTLNYCMASNVGLIKPDVVCFIDERYNQTESLERYDDEEFQNLVYANFQKLRESNWITINGTFEERCNMIMDAWKLPHLDDLRYF